MMDDDDLLASGGYCAPAPPPRCPNCLATMGLRRVSDTVAAFDNMRHWHVDAVVDGVEHGNWECAKRPDDELAAAGYLMRYS